MYFSNIFVNAKWIYFTAYLCYCEFFISGIWILMMVVILKNFVLPAQGLLLCSSDFSSSDFMLLHHTYLPFSQNLNAFSSFSCCLGYLSLLILLFNLPLPVELLIMKSMEILLNVIFVHYLSMPTVCNLHWPINHLECGCAQITLNMLR